MKPIALIAFLAFVSCISAAPLSQNQDIIDLLESAKSDEQLLHDLKALKSKNYYIKDITDIRYIHDTVKDVKQECTQNRVIELGAALRTAERIHDQQLKSIAKGLLDNLDVESYGIKCVADISDMAKREFSHDEDAKKWMDKAASSLSDTTKEFMFYYTLSKETSVWDNDLIKKELLSNEESRQSINQACSKIINDPDIGQAVYALADILNNTTEFRTEEVKDELRHQTQEQGPNAIKFLSFANLCKSFNEFAEFNRLN